MKALFNKTKKIAIIATLSLPLTSFAKEPAPQLLQDHIEVSGSGIINSIQGAGFSVGADAKFYPKSQTGVYMNGSLSRIGEDTYGNTLIGLSFGKDDQFRFIWDLGAFETTPLVSRSMILVGGFGFEYNGKSTKIGAKLGVDAIHLLNESDFIGTGEFTTAGKLSLNLEGALTDWLSVYGSLLVSSTDNHVDVKAGEEGGYTGQDIDYKNLKYGINLKLGEKVTLNAEMVNESVDYYLRKYQRSTDQYLEKSASRTNRSPRIGVKVAL